MSNIPLIICLLTLLNAIYRHDLPSSLVFLFGASVYALNEFKQQKELSDIQSKIQEFTNSLDPKWIAFDHNFKEINKKLVEHDNIITKGAIGLMSGLKKVQK